MKQNDPLVEKLSEYLKSKGLEFSFDYEYEAFQGSNYTYARYISTTLQIITGISENNILDNYKDRAVYDMELINKIVHCLSDSKDPELFWVAWDSFSDVSSDERFLLFKDFNDAREKYLKHLQEKFVSNHTHEIQTERLVLKPNDSSGSGDLYEYISKNDKTNHLFASMISLETLPKYLTFILFEKESNNVIGSITIYSRSDAFDPEWNFSYYIKKKYRKKGFAKEGSLAVLDAIRNDEIVMYGEMNRIYVLEEAKPNIRIVRLNANEDNLASCNLARSLGFAY
jgi:RimJ/RimL family protein N-acetyltransferase